MLGLSSDCPRTARTVLGLRSDYVGECKVLSFVIISIAWQPVVILFVVHVFHCCRFSLSLSL